MIYYICCRVIQQNDINPAPSRPNWRLLMKNLLRNTAFTTLSALILVILSSCATNYRVQLIRSARSYALEQHPELSDEDIHTIKFTTPKIQENTLYSRDGSNKNKNDIVQTVAVWDLPGQPGKSLMVVGFGQRRLHNWNPNRVIIKHFRKIPSKKKAGELE